MALGFNSLFPIVSLFRYGNLRIEIPKEYECIYYPTFIVSEYDFLKFKKEDNVLDQYSRKYSISIIINNTIDDFLFLINFWFNAI